jgi:hypothetical protein
MSSLIDSLLGKALTSFLLGLVLLAGFSPHGAQAKQPASAEAARDDSVFGPGRVGGLSPTAVERIIAQRLRDPKFLQNP